MVTVEELKKMGYKGMKRYVSWNMYVTEEVTEAQSFVLLKAFAERIKRGYGYKIEEATLFRKIRVYIDDIKEHHGILFYIERDMTDEEKKRVNEELIKAGFDLLVE